MLGLTILVFYHVYLASTYQTTYEHRKGTYDAYYWRPFNTRSICRNFFQRVFTRMNPRPYFEPLELYDPEKDEYKIPELKTLQSQFEYSQSMVSRSEISP